MLFLQQNIKKIPYIFAVMGPKRNPPSDLRAGGGVKKP